VPVTRASESEPAHLPTGRTAGGGRGRGGTARSAEALPVQCVYRVFIFRSPGQAPSGLKRRAPKRGPTRTPPPVVPDPESLAAQAGPIPRLYCPGRLGPLSPCRSGRMKEGSGDVGGVVCSVVDGHEYERCPILLFAHVPQGNTPLVE
jgi:hypothetical protein